MSVQGTATLIAAITVSVSGLIYLVRKAWQLRNYAKVRLQRFDKFLADFFGRPADEYTGAPKVSGALERLDRIERKLNNGMTHSLAAIEAQGALFMERLNALDVSVAEIGARRVRRDDLPRPRDDEGTGT